LKSNGELEILSFNFKVYGSAANTFWTNDSDIDVSLIIEEAFRKPPVISFVQEIASVSRKSCYCHQSTEYRECGDGEVNTYTDIEVL
jgi:predicted nucleotidyltransferase